MVNVPLAELTPNEHGDWISLRTDGYHNLISIAPINKFDRTTMSFFVTQMIGIVTSRDAWVYNYSKLRLKSNVQTLINNYNSEVKLIIENPSHIVNTNPTDISWSVNLHSDYNKRKYHTFLENSIILGIYRPFTINNLYLNKSLIERPGLSSTLFPSSAIENLVICVSGLGGTKENSALITNQIPDLNMLDAGTQCFPLYYYEPAPTAQADMFAAPRTGDGLVRRDGISDWILAQARQRYGAAVSKEDIFYYVYGFLHSPDYRTTYANDLKKMLPRLPLVAQAADFWAFSRAGRALAALHVDYEQVPAHPQVVVTGAEQGFFAVEKMRFPAKDRKDTIIYNSAITISHIPAAAYDYVVNGKSAIEWVLERYAVTTHKESGIVNDPNDWAAEVGNPRYILDLLLSVIHVSTQTVAIVAGLPQVMGE